MLLTVSVPAAAGGYGLVALAVCIALPHMTDQRSASLLPVLAAIPVVRLATVAAPTADFAPLARLGLLAVPTFVAVVGSKLPYPWSAYPWGCWFTCSDPPRPNCGDRRR